MREKYDSDVGSSYPGAGEGPKGLAVRQLKRYASWVQTVQERSNFCLAFSQSESRGSVITNHH